MRSRALLCLVLFAAGSVAPAAGAKVYHSREEALALAFPEADRIEPRSYVLTDVQAARIAEVAHGPLETRIVKLHTATRGGEVIGYAFIDTHTVRTQPEAFLVVLSSEGEVRSLRLLAFHEPSEYQPTKRWYGQFERKSLAAPLRVGGDIHGIAGATLSARATTRGVRRALALYEVLIRNGE